MTNYDEAVQGWVETRAEFAAEGGVAFDAEAAEDEFWLDDLRSDPDWLA